MSLHSGSRDRLSRRSSSPSRELPEAPDSTTPSYYTLSPPPRLGYRGEDSYVSSLSPSLPSDVHSEAQRHSPPRYDYSPHEFDDHFYSHDHDHHDYAHPDNADHHRSGSTYAYEPHQFPQGTNPNWIPLRPHVPAADQFEAEAGSRGLSDMMTFTESERAAAMAHHSDHEHDDAIGGDVGAQRIPSQPRERAPSSSLAFWKRNSSPPGGQRPDRETRRQRRRERLAAAFGRHGNSNRDSAAQELLSGDALAKLLGSTVGDEDCLSHLGERSRDGRDEASEQGHGQRQRKRPVIAEQPIMLAPIALDTPRGGAQSRAASGAQLEQGMAEVRHRGGGFGGNGADGEAAEATDGMLRKEGDWDERSRGSRSTGRGSVANLPFWKKWRGTFIFFVVLVVLAAIAIPVGIIMARRAENGGSSAGSDDDKPANSNLDGISRDSIPAYARGTYLDPFTWYDTVGFNVTFTNATVGGLSIMGLNSTWDDSAQANENVPPLNESFPYGSQPIRGVNLGGWLSIEPFIVPSLFQSYSSSEGIIDEWTLCERLGSDANTTIEKHYATFITEQDFIDIRDAGLDHVRMQFSYWAVRTYDGDPYVPKIAWRYLLRAIEYCRKYGLRVNLDPHGIPGSQNGWNHSGHQGKIGWLNGTDGALNRQRSLDMHDQLSQFFAQDRYKNVVTIYGLANEPLMLSLPVADVLNWTTQATELVQKNGIKAWVTVHDGFLNLAKWDSMLKTRPDNMMLDTHQYTVFNTGEIVLNHTRRVELICESWYSMIQAINVTSTGWGPTICGEWSQADTDCAQYVNNVGNGNRWEGTLASTGDTMYCPTASEGTCSCTLANTSPVGYSDGYKTFLQTYAEAQMSAFETAMGWFYWTWATESAAQWSYRTAWKNGYMPAKAYSPKFKCGDTIPSFGDLPEYY